MKDVDVKGEINLLCTKAGEIAEKISENTETKSAWGQSISPRHLKNIYTWINRNESLIFERINSSPEKRTGLFLHGEINLYVTIDFVMPLEGPGEVIFRTNSNRANHKDDVRLKEEKLHSKPKTKIIQQGGERTVKKCLHWNRLMAEPQPYVAKVSKGKAAFELAKKEEIISYIIGSTYANPTCLGSSRFKNEITFVTVYSPQAIGDFLDWSVNKISFSSFLLTIYKTALIMSFMHQLNIIWRDLKPDNFLRFAEEKNILPKATDFTSAIWPGVFSEVKGSLVTYRYCPPEGDPYLVFRKEKIAEIQGEEAIKNLARAYCQATSEIDRMRYEKLHNDAMEQDKMNKEITYWTYWILTDDKYKKDFNPAAKMIYKTKEIKNLLPSEDNKGGVLIFPPSPADDVWGFCRWMDDLITRVVKNSIFPKNKDTLLKIWEVFKNNMNLFCNSRGNSTGIILSLEDFLRESCKDTIEEIERLKIQDAECLKSAKIRMGVFKQSFTVEENTGTKKLNTEKSFIINDI